MGAIYKDGVCYSASGGGGGGASSADQVSLDDTNLAYEADDVQEAFEKVTKSLTYVEYEALTDAEKNNGTIYLITDINGTGDKFQPVIYSTKEREIGVWKDGKPLYQKTISITNASKDSNYDLGITDFDICFVYGGSFGSGIIPYLHGAYPDNSVGGFLDQTGSSLAWAFRCGSQAPATISGFITVRYTKITDTPGSGIWTPQGVPAHHYSTDEQVVGTWIDGSALYEKTFYSDTIISYDSASAVTLNDTIPSNIEVVDIQAYFRGENSGSNQIYQSDGGKWFNYYYESYENKIYASQIFTSAGVTNCKTYFTIRYTKSIT